MRLTPRAFMTGAIASLLWNVVGVAFFVFQSRMDIEELAHSDPYQAHMFGQMPPWAWTAYAVAVAGGLSGALLLLARSRLAVAAFGLSLVAVLVEFGYAFALTNLLVVKGAGAAAFPVLIILLAGLQLWLARCAREARLIG